MNWVVTGLAKTILVVVIMVRRSADLISMRSIHSVVKKALESDCDGQGGMGESGKVWVQNSEQWRPSVGL